MTNISTDCCCLDDSAQCLLVRCLFQRKQSDVNVSFRYVMNRRIHGDTERQTDRQSYACRQLHTLTRTHRPSDTDKLKHAQKQLHIHSKEAQMYRYSHGAEASGQGHTGTQIQTHTPSNDPCRLEPRKTVHAHVMWRVKPKDNYFQASSRSGRRAEPCGRYLHA